MTASGSRCSAISLAWRVSDRSGLVIERDTSQVTSDGDDEGQSGQRQVEPLARAASDSSSSARAVISSLTAVR